MVDQIIRPSALPRRTNPVASEIVPVDNGTSVAGSTLAEIVNAGRPLASRAEAEAGANAEKAMTPLTVDQKIEYEIGRSLASKAQGDKADSAIQEIVAGANTTVDNTDPQRPILSSSGGTSVGFKSDIVVIDGQDDWRIARNYKTVSDLLADDGSGEMGMGYAGSGANVIVSSGDIVTAQGFRYEVATSGATDAWLIETAGGVKLSFAGGSVATPMAFGALALDDNSLDDPAFVKAYAYLDSIGGGVLRGDLGAIYTLRQTYPPSNVVIRDMFVKQVIEAEPLGQWEILKYIFRVEENGNVLFDNLVIDGQRGSQNMDNAGTDNGGCTAFYFAKGARGCTIRNTSVTMMGTDAVSLYGYTDAVSPNDGPYDITIENCAFSYSRRNEISPVSVDGLKIINCRLISSGQVVSGTQSGADINYVSGSPWAAPAIDMEPEARCTVRNVTIEQVVIDGCRSGIFLYNGNQVGNSIQGIRIHDVEIRNLAPNSGTSILMAILNTSPSGKEFNDIEIGDIRLYGKGVVQLWGGDGVIVDNITGYSTDGIMQDNAFGVTEERYLNIRSAISNAHISRVSVGNFGLVTGEFGSIAQALTNIVFDESCSVARSQSNMPDQTVSGTRWLPEIAPRAQQALPLPVFESDHAYRSPIWFSGWRGTKPVGTKEGLLGWVPKSSSTRTASASSAGSTLNVNVTTSTDLGASIAVQYSPGGRWYHGTITTVASGTSYTVSPALASAVNAGQTATLVRWQEAYGIAKQPNIANVGAAPTQSDFNALLAALRAANIIGDV